MLDLSLVVADKNMDQTVQGILNRPKALGIRPIEFKTVVHPGHDGGVRTNGPELLAPLHSVASHGIIMLDWEGSGADGDAASVETELDRRLRVTWEDRAKSIVIEPELDIWIWGANNAIRQALDCPIVDIRGWLRTKEFEILPNQKPARPKEAFECLMAELSEQRSSANYKKIAERISLERCGDPAFLRFRWALRSWFA